VRRLPQDQLLYERRNSRFVLQVTGHPAFGVPFGQDRRVPIFLATLAVQQKSQTIRFRTAAEMLETFGMPTGGKEYRRLVQAFERVFGATIFFGTETTKTTSGSAKVIQRSRFNFSGRRGFGTAETRSSRRFQASSKTSSSSATISIRRSSHIRSRMISRPSSYLVAHPLFSTSTCGSATDASKREARKRSQSSVGSDWRISSGVLSTADHDGFAQCLTSSSRPYGQFGLSVRLPCPRVAKVFGLTMRQPFRRTQTSTRIIYDALMDMSFSYGPAEKRK